MYAGENALKSKPKIDIFLGGRVFFPKTDSLSSIELTEIP